MPNWAPHITVKMIFYIWYSYLKASSIFDMNGKLFDFQAVRFGHENIQFVTAANELYTNTGSIVAVSGVDNTKVTFQDPTGKVWSRTLGRLQTYTHTVTARRDDLTGYMINSNKPVSLFSGTKNNHVLGYREDPMYVSLPPVAFWGTTYFIAPILERHQPAGHATRVIAIEEMEVRDLKGGMITTLNAQEFHESRPVEHGDVGGGIKCSRPCLVVQYVLGKNYDRGNVDCAMRLVPSVESYVGWILLIHLLPVHCSNHHLDILDYIVEMVFNLINTSCLACINFWHNVLKYFYAGKYCSKD